MPSDWMKLKCRHLLRHTPVYCPVSRPLPVHAIGWNDAGIISLGTQSEAAAVHESCPSCFCSFIGICAVGMQRPCGAPFLVQQLANGFAGSVGPGSHESAHAPVFVLSSGL